jgi:hypothetical protein
MMMKMMDAQPGSSAIQPDDDIAQAFAEIGEVSKAKTPRRGRAHLSCRPARLHG